MAGLGCFGSHVAEVTITVVADRGRTTYWVSTVVYGQGRNAYFAWDGAPVGRTAQPQSAAAMWVAPLPFPKLHLLAEDQMTFCPDTGEAWFRSGSGLVRIASSG